MFKRKILNSLCLGVGTFMAAWPRFIYSGIICNDGGRRKVVLSDSKLIEISMFTRPVLVAVFSFIRRTIGAN